MYLYKPNPLINNSRKQHSNLKKDLDSMVLFIKLFKMVLTTESENEI